MFAMCVCRRGEILRLKNCCFSTKTGSLLNRSLSGQTLPCKDTIQLEIDQ